MKKEEWIIAIKRSKCLSISSIFSKQTYAVYKYLLESDRMIYILTRYYNTIIEQQYYPKRWLKILEVMIEKGKGAKLGKLRTIQLIEANLQMIMQIGINTRNRGRIEADKRISKSSYGLRLKYLIEIAILQKHLIYDNSKLTIIPTIHNMTDLEACYDRKLANIGSIVEELVGIE